jgi:hypothetical protein
MGAEDIRISTSISSSLKIKKLVQKLGYAGMSHLIILWCWAATNRPKGNTADIADEDLEMISEWNGTQGSFAKALRELRFIDQNGNLNNW